MALSLTSVSFMSLGDSVSELETHNKLQSHLHPLTINLEEKIYQVFSHTPVLCVISTGVFEAGLSPLPETA